MHSSPPTLLSPLDRLRWVERVAQEKLPATCYRLAATLAMQAKNGTAYKSRRHIAADLGCDEARLVPAFNALMNAGLLVKGQLRGAAGRQTFEWHFAFPSTASTAPGAESTGGAEVAPPAEVAPGAQSEVEPPAEVATDPLRKSHPKGGIEGGRKREAPLTDTKENDNMGPLRGRGCIVDHRDGREQQRLRSEWTNACRGLTYAEIAEIIDTGGRQVFYAKDFIPLRRAWEQRTGWQPRNQEQPLTVMSPEERAAETERKAKETAKSEAAKQRTPEERRALCVILDKAKGDVSQPVGASC